MPPISDLYKDDSANSYFVEKTESERGLDSPVRPVSKPRRWRKSNPSNRPVYLYAKYSGTCSCGRRISMGDMICYDGPTRQALCMPCGKNKTRTTSSDSQGDKVSNGLRKLLRRFTELKELPSPSEEHLTELSQLEAKLSKKAQEALTVRAALLKSRVRGSVLAIKARYAGNCSVCGNLQNAGETIAFDPAERKIICYACLPADTCLSSPD